MNEKIYGHASEFMRVGRILTKGQIVAPGIFKLNEVPFSVYIRPKAESEGADVLINCRLYEERMMSPVPVSYNEWAPLAVVELLADDVLLQHNDVYWGAGKEVR